MTDERTGMTQSSPVSSGMPGTLLDPSADGPSADGPSADGPSADGSDKSLADLFKDLSQQTGTLVQQELELARVELFAKGRRLMAGGGTLGGAGLLAVLALGALVACAIAALALAIPVWASALVVAFALLAAAGVLGVVGKTAVQRGSPPVPEEAVESTKEDLAWIKSRAKSAKP